MGVMIIFTEYLKEADTATFEFHALVFPLGVTHNITRAEMRLREIILSFADKDMTAFGETPSEETFICPMCHAQYSFRSLRISEDGLTQCQYCGKYARPTRHETPSDLDMTVIDDDESKH